MRSTVVPVWGFERELVFGFEGRKTEVVSIRAPARTRNKVGENGVRGRGFGFLI